MDLNITINVLSKKKDNLKAFANVIIDDYQFFGLKVVENKHQKLFVSYPQRSFKGKDGSDVYLNIFKFSVQDEKNVFNAILGAYHAKVGEKTSQAA